MAKRYLLPVYIMGFVTLRISCGQCSFYARGGHTSLSLGGGIFTIDSHHHIDESDKIKERYPYIAFIYLEDEHDAWRCSGTLVAADLVLSSAHCLPEEASKYAGEVTVGPRGETVDIIKHRIHPRFRLNGYPDYDVALLKLDRCIDVKPVKLDVHTETLQNNQEVELLTWGRYGPNEESEYDTVHELTTRVNESCEPWRSRKDLGNLTTNMICALGKETEMLDVPSYGDSGAPLLLRGGNATDDVQVGLVSFGYHGPDEPNPVPSVYGKVSAMHGWIVATMDNLSRCTMEI